MSTGSSTWGDHQREDWSLQDLEQTSFQPRKLCLTLFQGAECDKNCVQVQVYLSLFMAMHGKCVYLSQSCFINPVCNVHCHCSMTLWWWAVHVCVFRERVGGETSVGVDYFALDDLLTRFIRCKGMVQLQWQQHCPPGPAHLLVCLRCGGSLPRPFLHPKAGNPHVPAPLYTQA